MRYETIKKGDIIYHQHPDKIIGIVVSIEKTNNPITGNIVHFLNQDGFLEKEKEVFLNVFQFENIDFAN
jgi:hypothetical protein